MNIKTLVAVSAGLLSGFVRAEMTETDCSFVATLDGTTQKYLKLTPTTLMEAPIDVFIVLHGHGSDRTQIRLTRGECQSVKDIAEQRGMLVISPDYRAKTSWMGPAAEADMLQLLGILKGEYVIGHVFFVGGSMGGSSSLTFAGLHPDLVDGVVAFNPLADHMTYENFQDAIAASFGGTKEQVPEEYRKRSAINHVEELAAAKMPMSVTLGGQDTSVPPASARQMAAAINELNPGQVYVDEVATRGHETDYAASVKAIKQMLKGVYGEDEEEGTYVDVIASWPFGESGLSDASGNGHDLVAGTDVTLTSAGTLRMAGTAAGNPNSSLRTQGKLDLSGVDAVTVSGWFRYTGSTLRIFDVFETTTQWYTSRQGALDFYFDYGTSDLYHSLAMMLKVPGDGNYSGVVGTKDELKPTDNAWHHFAAVYRKSSTYPEGTTIYIDGRKDTNAARDIFQKTTEDVIFSNDILYIGGRAGKATFEGELEDWTVFGRVLDDDEVSARYLEGPGGRYKPDVVWVTATPDEMACEDLLPSYGISRGYAIGVQVNFACPNPPENWKVAGWNLYTNRTGTSEWVLWRNSAADFGSFGHPGVAVKLEWRFERDVIASWPFGAVGLNDTVGSNPLTKGDGVEIGEFARLSGTSAGNAASFLKTTSKLNLSSAEAVTVECWLRYHVSPTWENIVYEHSENFTTVAGAMNGYYRMSTGTFQASEKVGTSGYATIQSSVSPFAEAEPKWHHLAVVYPKGPYSKARLFLDGKDDTHEYIASQTSDTSGQAFANAVLYLGGRNATGTFDGDLDEITIYGRALPEMEVADRFTQGRRDLSDGSVQVVGSPFCLTSSAMSPAYGVTTGHAKGEVVAFSAAMPMAADCCDGWNVYTNVAGTARWALWQSGAGLQGAFEHPGVAVRLEWRWRFDTQRMLAVEYPVAVSRTAVKVGCFSLQQSGELRFAYGTSPATQTSTVSLGMLPGYSKAVATIDGLEAGRTYFGRFELWDGDVRIGLSKTFQFGGAAASSVARWTFDSTETGLLDVSGNGNDLVAGMGVELTDDGTVRLGGASATSLKTKSALRLSTLAALSVSGWFKYEAAEAKGFQLIETSPQWYGNVGALDIYWDQGWGTLGLMLAVPGTRAYSGVSGTLNSLDVMDGQWHHYAAVLTKTNEYPYGTTLYIDGRMDVLQQAKYNKATAGTTFKNDVAYIGARNGTSDFFTGQMDEIRFDGDALSPREVRTEYAKFRYEREGKYVPGLMIVTGKPEDVSGEGFYPAFGATYGYLEGETVVPYVPDPVQTAEGPKSLGSVLRWTLSTNVAGTAKWVVWKKGDGMLESFVYPAAAVKLDWKLHPPKGLVIVVR